MKNNSQQQVLRQIEEKMASLTAKANLIGRFVLENPDQVIFMSVRKLAAVCGTSEGSVMRFTRQLGYPGYAEFLEALRGRSSDKKIREMAQIAPHEKTASFMGQALKNITGGIDQFSKSLNEESYQNLVNLIAQSRELYIIGSGLTFHYAAQFGRELSLIRKKVRALDASDPAVWDIIADISKLSAVIFFPDSPCRRETVAAAEAFYQQKVPLATLCTRLPCPLAAYSTLLLTYGASDNNSSETAMNLPFLIYSLIQAAKTVSIEPLSIISSEVRQQYLSGNDLLFNHEHTLKIGIWSSPSSLDPAYATGTRTDFPVILCLFNGLVKFKEGSWDPVPDLAKSWKISRDKRQITFFLEKKVPFHRGYGELTAKDVKFSLERAAEGNFKVNLRIIEKISIIDRYTVKLILKAPCSHLFSAILPFTPGQIVSQKALEEMGPTQFAFSPVGTGPYELGSHSPSGIIKLQRFHDYWGTTPKMKSICFLPIHDHEVPQKAKSGEIDIVRLPFVSFKKIRDLPNMAYDVNQGLDYWLVGFNVTRPPFNDLRVRQAIRSAIDVNRIIKKAFWGVPERAHAPIPPEIIGHWREAPQHGLDRKKACQLLKEVIGKNRISAELLIIPSETIFMTAEIVKENLQQIGIDLSINVQSLDKMNQLAIQGQCDLYLTFFTGIMDPSTVLNWFRSGERWNFSHWNNPEYDRLVDLAEFEMNTEKRNELYIQAQKIIDQDCWAVWLTNGAGILLRQRHIVTGKTFPDGSLAPWLIQKK
jgi:peptide/nickel transport system substrate-binding protein